MPSTGSDPTVRQPVPRSAAVACGERCRRLRWIVSAAVLAILLTSCGDSRGAQLTADYPPIVVSPAPIASGVWQQRGEVTAQSAFTDSDSTLADVQQRALRATYRSVSAVTGRQTEVSGAFFIPKGLAPEGGWPVIALGHGTTGAVNNCGLSSVPDLRGYAPLVAGFLASGYAVAVTDYEGLGPDGAHPFLEPRTAAFNLIDSVRALREVDPSVSSRWLAYGISQGGQTSWAAAEFNSWYGRPLDLVGAVALAPAADVVGLSELAYRHELSSEQLTIAPMVIAGLARYDASIDVSQYLRGTSLRLLDVLIGCQPSAPRDRATATTQEDVGPTTAANARTLTDALRRIALPQRPLSVPLLVLNGLEDRTILPQWVSEAVGRSCELGGTIDHREVRDAGHGDLQPGSELPQWIADRFAGKPAESNCG